MDEPVCFVPTGRQHSGGDFMLVDSDNPFARMSYPQPGRPGYRRLEPGWLDAAVERVRTLYNEHYRRHCPSEKCYHPLAQDIRAALFPPSEPEPEDWEREAAGEWLRGAPEAEARSTDALARHFAKARRAREEQP